MIDFSRTNIHQLCTHYAGNFGLGQDLVLSEHPYQFKDEIVQQVFFNYLLQGFDNDIFYHFYKDPNRRMLDGVQYSVQEIFKDKNTLFHQSKAIANHLYKQTMHPKISGGILYVAYLNDVVMNGELCDAVGIFKSEEASKDTFIKVDHHAGEFDIATDLGINPKKLDKGVLIFNLEQQTGYKAVMIDKGLKISEATMYWSHDFLDMQLKESSYSHTETHIKQCIGFCEEMLTQDNNVKPADKMMVMNKSMRFFNEKDVYHKPEFEKEVLIAKDMIEAFNEYQKKYRETYNVKPIETFDISRTAVKKNKKFLANKVALDENFEITIHKNHQFVETGFDEAMGMKYYKLFYVNEVEK